MTKTILLAVLALGMGAMPALAAEGNGEPFPNNAGSVEVRVYPSARPARDTGSAAYPDTHGLPGSDLPALAGDVLPGNGSQGAVQTANSLPRGFEDGTVALTQAVRVQTWVAAHARRHAPAYAAAPRALPSGG